MYTKTVANNKKAYHDFEVREKFECGIELVGTEVKSVKNNGASIKEAYVKIKDNEVYIVGMNVKPYDFGNRFNVDPLRDRKLLMNKAEIRKMKQSVQLDGMTIVPTSVYVKGRLVKVEIALAKGKNKHDKRQSLAKKDAERKMDRAIKSYN